MLSAGQLVRMFADILDVFLHVYTWMVIISAVLSWVRPDPYNPFVRFLTSMTEPVFNRVRRLLPLPPMGIDFSPIAVLLAVFLIQLIVVNTLRQISLQLY